MVVTPMSDADVSDEHVARAKAILKDHVGEANAITSQELSDELGGLDSLDSTPQTRAVVREVIAQHRLPVAGSANGYFVVASEDEYDAAIETLESRIIGIVERKTLLRLAYRENGDAYGDQSSLDGFGGVGQ